MSSITLELFLNLISLHSVIQRFVFLLLSINKKNIFKKYVEKEKQMFEMVRFCNRLAYRCTIDLNWHDKLYAQFCS